MQAQVRELEEQCRSQTEQFSLLAQELQAFHLHPGPLDLLTSALDCGSLGDCPPPRCCCSTPQPCRGSGPKGHRPQAHVPSSLDLDLPPAPLGAAPQSLPSLPLPPSLGSLEGQPRRQSLSPTPPTPSPSTTAPSHALHLRWTQPVR
ncbi:peripheral-type benzodiazepine receptor-associated protein 1-like [Nomascus leucogenys]|uniref:peripheral-type benzodiazepine receptor-associated protein 1-like n=1 Tax=Nomascus leucogenys TaxID=61853 RepID=UPI00122D5209|nr:peripheral-type benzodiazepine receptor-associated protein 1-like [Nomascus leucogenys]